MRTIPALNDSPRSTRGRTRTIAYSNGLRASPPGGSCGPGTVGLRDERPWPLEPGEQVVDIRAPVRVGIRQAVLGPQPVVGDGGRERLERRAVEARRQAGVRIGDRARKRE